MHKFILTIGLLWTFDSTAAVHLSTDGKAQAMIVPYYTVANGVATLLSIDNTTKEFKALKIHLRETKKGDAIYTFNLYLASKDIEATESLRSLTTIRPPRRFQCVF